MAEASLPNLAPSGTANPNALLDSSLEPVQTMMFTDAQVEEYREQDRFLPIANVARIMKNSLPPSAKISKEAKECVQECVSEFISFITSEAADKCLNEKRKTIGGEDILTSMQVLGFDNYAGVMKVYLAKFRIHQSTQTRKTHEDDSIKDDAEDEDDEGVPAGKKKRRKGEVKKRKRESDEPHRDSVQ